MKLSLIDLLERIHGSQQPDDFFKEDVDLEMEEYLEMITEYSPEGETIFASDCRTKRKKIYADFDEKVIDMDGIIMFYYMLHDDDFYCKRVKNTEEMYSRLYEAVRDPFIGELMVFENGVKRNYRVKNAFEEILHSESDRRKLHELIIEWY